MHSGQRTGRAHHLISVTTAARIPGQDPRRVPRPLSHDLNLKEPEPAAQSLLLARHTGAPRCVRLIEDPLARFHPYAQAQRVAELLQLAAA